MNNLNKLCRSDYQIPITVVEGNMGRSSLAVLAGLTAKHLPSRLGSPD
jgi:hypothetical protein